MATFLSTLFLVVCILLIIIVLLQKGRGGGLGAALGGGAGQSAFGTRTGDVFTWVTIVLTALFLLLAIFTSVAYRPATAEVAMPELTPASWPAGQTKPIGVTMSAAKDAKIHYTVDGSEPTQNSPQYAKDPVIVSEGTVVKAIAVRLNRASKVNTVVYSREAAQTPAPTTTLPATTSPTTTNPADLATPKPATATTATAPAAIPAEAK